VGFLKHLRHHLKGRLLLIWDRITIHRSRLVRDYLDPLRGRVQVEHLPAYAPELNPIEYLWGYWKKNELANFCPRDIWELGHFASQALKRIRRRKSRARLIASFYRQAELF